MKKDYVRPLDFRNGRIDMNHGAGGRAQAQLIDELFARAFDKLRKVVWSMADAARAAGVPVVAGDTKVVEQGKGDGVFITTTGVGVVPRGRSIGGANAKPGDMVLLSGTIGDHGAAVMSKRESLEFEIAQRLFVELRAWGHEVTVEFDIADAVTGEAVALAEPHLVRAPFLKRRIPESVWRRLPCLVVHPGPPGDGGPWALDHAILDGERDWGVSVLQATGELDAGPVWAWAPFAMRDASKGDLYRREVVDAAVCAMRDALARGCPGTACPTPPCCPRTAAAGSRW